MRVKRLLFVALIAFPMMGMAQSRYEEVNDSTPKAKLENMKVNAAYQQWLGQYEEVGRKSMIFRAISARSGQAWISKEEDCTAQDRTC